MRGTNVPLRPGEGSRLLDPGPPPGEEAGAGGDRGSDFDPLYLCVPWVDFDAIARAENLESDACEIGTQLRVVVRCVASSVVAKRIIAPWRRALSAV